MKHAKGAPIPWLTKTEAISPGPLHRQVYQRVRGAILNHELVPGARLPSTRILAGELGVSRNTVELAFEQLEAEGFLVRRPGSGSYVCRTLPGSPRGLRERKATQTSLLGGVADPAAPSAPLSPRGQKLSEVPWRTLSTAAPLAFGPCLPELEHFPLKIWNRLAAQRARLSSRQLLGTGNPGGYQPLREAIAAYLGPARGVRCRWEQVIITTSTQQSLDLATRLLLERGDRAWMEEPGYVHARAIMEANQLRVTPVPVDSDGIDVAFGCRRAPRARFAYVTPSHQFPLGYVLSLERRLALLRWAEGAGAWIFEDDYDSEFRYAGRPLAALQGLDTTGQVLYAGTFHKVLYPALRLAYLVVPEVLVDAFVSARGAVDGFSPPLTQAVLADFLAQGHFTSHLRQMRVLYRQRRDTLLHALAASPVLSDHLRIGPTEAGLHIVCWLAENLDDQSLSNMALGLGLGIHPLSRYYAGQQAVRHGLFFHYAATAPELIVDGIRRLADALASNPPACHGSKVVLSSR